MARTDLALPGTAESAEARLRARLPRTWYALFAHHPSLRPIQREGIGPLLDGREALLCAPTAGGKTEALVAAALEHAAVQLEHGPSVVYVCPTRALVNDVHRRLEPIAHRLHLRVGRHTADHRPDKDRLPHLLVTTPEGLDSRLARHSGTLKGARWLLLDELHLLAGTARGDQLAALTWRLRLLVEGAGGRLTVAAASATLPEAEEVAARYLSDAVIVRVPGRPTTPDVVVRSAPDVPHAVAAIDGLPGKTLVFANSRTEVEALAHALYGRAPWGDAVYAHHGSLLKPERERVEASFAQRRTALCVATNTLELGIDIGDVDRVVLFGPPPDVSALVQRIGRAGRRTGRPEVVALAETPARAVRFAFLLDRAAAGDLCGEVGPYHPGSVVQQACSLLYQNKHRTLSTAALIARLPPWQAAYWTQTRLEAALRARRELFKPGVDGLFRPADALADAFERGRMHSQLAFESGGVVVYDAVTARAIGTVGEAVVGQTLTLGGRAAAVQSVRSSEVWVRGVDAAGPARFRPRPGPVVGYRDARAWLHYLGVPEGAGAILNDQWAHGLGEALGRIFAVALSALDVPVAPDGPLTWLIGGGAAQMRAGPPLHVPEAVLERSVERQERTLARLTGQGPDFNGLPKDERRRALLHAYAPERLAALWSQLRWVQGDDTLAARLAVVSGAAD
jgi:ATP-dependent Lhr-like helicase